MEQVKKLGCNAERSSRSEVVCFDHKPKCKFGLKETLYILMTGYQSITSWMPPCLWAARAEYTDRKIQVTKCWQCFTINPSFFLSWDKAYYTTVYDMTRSGWESYIQIFYDWRRKSKFSVFTFTNSTKASQTFNCPVPWCQAYILMIKGEFGD